MNWSWANIPRPVGYHFLHRQSSPAAECRTLCPSYSPEAFCIQGHWRCTFLALITPAAPDPSPPNYWHFLGQNSAVPFCFHSCGEIGKGALVLSGDSPTSLLAQWSGRGLWLSPIISSGAAPKCLPTRHATQLPANAAGVLATARSREPSSHLHVFALLLSLQKCGIYRYRPSGKTQAHLDIGQSQLSFLFDLIWNCKRV